MKKSLKMFGWTALLSLALLSPTISFAQSTTATGITTITIADQDGHAMTGNWFLHQGLSDTGLLVRNGSAGESFALAPGNYFLKTQSVAGYDSGLVTTTNPQTLTDAGRMRFNVVYTKKAADTTDSFINRYNADADEIARIATERAGNSTTSTAHGFKTVEPTTASTASPGTTTPASVVTTAPAPVTTTAVSTTGIQLAETGPGFLWAWLIALGASFAVARSKTRA